MRQSRYFLAFCLIPLYSIVIRENDSGFEGFYFFFGHQGVCHDNNSVAHMYEVRRSPIDADTTATAFARNDVGLDACAIGVIYDLHFLACVDIGSIHEVFINGDTTDVV